MEARSGITAELVLAADQFLISPVGRTADTVQARSIGDESPTVIAGYHWFTDWGRDTMISLEGLTIATGRTREGEYILRSFAKYIRDGLIPNMFPEGKTRAFTTQPMRPCGSSMPLIVIFVQPTTARL